MLLDIRDYIKEIILGNFHKMLGNGADVEYRHQDGETVYNSHKFLILQILKKMNFLQ